LGHTSTTNQQSTTNKQQSTINNQPPTNNNQQTTTNNQQITIYPFSKKLSFLILFICPGLTQFPEGTVLPLAR
jgi:hypothetical protein